MIRFAPELAGEYRGWIVLSDGDKEMRYEINVKVVDIQKEYEVMAP